MQIKLKISNMRSSSVMTPTTAATTTLTTTTTSARPRRCLIGPLTRAPRNTRGCLNSHIISLALISYVLSYQMAVIILGSPSPAPKKVGDAAVRQDFDISENIIDTQTQTYKLSPYERSIVQLVAASPRPAAPRSVTAATHRVPPLNGSIFGKRSLDNKRGKARQSRPADGASNNIDAAAAAAATTPAASPSSYNDIITELIENFMSQNNEDDPAETTAAFCRMIVYECQQVLRGRKSRLSSQPRIRDKSS